MDAIVAEVQSLLPPRWSASRGEGGFHISMFSPDPSHVVQRPIFVSNDGALQVFVHGQELSQEHPVFKKCTIKSLFSETRHQFVSQVVTFVSEVRLMEICMGASNTKYKIWWKSSLDTCFIDQNSFRETRYKETLRSKSCMYLIQQPKKYCVKCTAMLMKFANRKPPISPTAERKTPNKYKPYKYCTSAEKQARDKRRAQFVRNLQRQNSRLRVRIQSLISEEGIDIDDELSSPLGTTVHEWLQKQADIDEKEKDEHIKFLEIFVQQQLEARKVRGNGGIKWHPCMIRFALQLKMSSHSALSGARKFLKLPGDRMLWDYTHIYDVEPGIQYQFVNETAERVQKMKYPYQKYHTLLFDEVTVSNNLVQRKSSGQVMGYCKLSEVQTELIELRKKLEDEAQGLKAQPIKISLLATKILTYMVRGTASDVMSCVASYTVDTLKKEDLHEYTWDVISCLESSGIKVMAMVCDGSTVNRGFIQMQKPKTETESGVVFDTVNPFDHDREIYFIPDPPHALKTARNCLESSGKKKSRNMKKNGESLTWDPIVRLFKSKSEQTIKKLHKLTAPCVYLNSFSRMSVPYCCRVVSNSVSSALRILNWPGTSEVSIFIEIQ